MPTIDYKEIKIFYIYFRLNNNLLTQSVSLFS